MGVLFNPQHQRFCEEFHKRVWAGESRRGASIAAYQAAGYRTKPEFIADNARKLLNRPDIKARLVEMRTRSATIAEIDAAWCILKLKGLVEANIDDYLATPDESGRRAFAIGNVSREKLGLLAELHQEEERTLGDDLLAVRKVRIKLHDRIAAIRLIREIAGVGAPAKVAATDPTGEHAAPPQVIEIVRFSPPPDGSKDQAAA